MVIHLLKKIVVFVIILFLLVQISFCLAYLTPNSPFSQLSVFDAYHDFFKLLLSGQLIAPSGKSISFINTFFATFELCLFTLLVSIIIGIPIGIVAGLGNIRSLYNIVHTLCLIIYAFPLVSIATIVMFLALPNWDQFMQESTSTLEDGVSLVSILMTSHSNKLTVMTQQLNILLLPIAILTIQPSIITIQLVSQNVRNMTSQNFIKMAVIRETSTFKILRRHLLPNAMPTAIPQLAYNITTILFSAMIIEIMFDINGIGKWVMLAYHQQNYHIIATAVITCGAFISVLVLLSEIVTMLMYPTYNKENYA